ncbi:MAG: ABC transporter, ABC-2 type transport system ATP-binding protein [Candidatus Gottesmanbacteria bacterium GW2011_GWA2_43_14]|uniref:ABC transporter, ABC-2 type transport system ATP-binding protein n=1 Tax=Candidatus Gottesmanbacteria bacterium GW2011_GWA2_43_14 TaxID=1618443 RepID=A0A0G1GAR8_9BACT|nr:MAG: ABC transporter, ABC-2 type transport system ATP-binding protein [Candidatus Gottesmanbacteria bacterium GW2011_GWA2_43_14]
MKTIYVSHLKKYYRIFKRREGLLSAFKSLVSRPQHTVKAVDDISFSIGEGELVGFIGPNGAGKTTTLKCLSGLLYPSAGVVEVLGFKPFKRNNNYLKQISLVMGQKNQLWWDLPAMESLRLNKEIYDLTERQFRENLEELSQLLEVGDMAKVPVRQLSLGQRMKMELIAALIHHPKVLFLDEPTIGLDIVMQKKMRDFIAGYNRNHKATIILTSHYMADVKELAKRVIIIDRGRLLYDGNLTDLIKKYADHKVITAHFEKEVKSEDFRKLGKLKSVNGKSVSFTVSRNRAKAVAVDLLKNYRIRDFEIEEPELEDVISIIFQSHPVSHQV